MLLDAGADPDLNNNEGKSPMDLANNPGFENVMEIFNKFFPE